MKIKILLTIGVVFLAITLSAVLFNDYAEGTNPYSSGRMIGQPAPDLSLKDLSGNEVSLASFKGKTVLLNFWATWCPYCRKERAELNTLHAEYKDRGLVIVSVSIDRSLEKLKRYMKEMPAEFIVLSDTEGSSAGSYEIMGLPTSYMIDSKGIVRHKNTGYKKWTSSSSRKIINDLVN
jgi:peroxiredoxin